MSLTKARIIEAVNEKTGLTKKDAAEIVELFFADIKEILDSGYNLKLSGFGKFILRDKRPRLGRNPRTLEEITITERRVVTFKASQKLKHAVNKRREAE
ncbi:MAG: integration host factor subunit alpha [Myxococcota bacterium]